MNKPKVRVTDAEIDAALERARLQPERPQAVSAQYNRALNLVVLHIDNGQRLEIPRDQPQGLEHANEAQLADIQIFVGVDTSHGPNWMWIMICRISSKANTPRKNGKKPASGRASRHSDILGG